MSRFEFDKWLYVLIATVYGIKPKTGFVFEPWFSGFVQLISRLLEMVPSIIFRKFADA